MSNTDLYPVNWWCEESELNIERSGWLPSHYYESRCSRSKIKAELGQICARVSRRSFQLVGSYNWILTAVSAKAVLSTPPHSMATALTIENWRGLTGRMLFLDSIKLKPIENVAENADHRAMLKNNDITPQSSAAVQRIQRFGQYNVLCTKEVPLASENCAARAHNLLKY